jgi:uncharacterized protein YjbJ (UPF0337 family)
VRAGGSGLALMNGRRFQMNQDIFQGRWQQIKGKVREKWGQLTDDDFTQIGGQKDQLVGRVQERYGLAREQAEREVNDWLNEQTELPRTRGTGM